MNTVACASRVIPLSRPWHQRWRSAVAEALQSLRAAWTASRGDSPEERIEAWDPQAVAELDDHVLRDIGAPDWVRVEAAVRREADRHAATLHSSHLLDRAA